MDSLEVGNTSTLGCMLKSISYGDAGSTFQFSSA